MYEVANSRTNLKTPLQLELQPLPDRCNEVLPSELVSRLASDRTPRGWWGMSRRERELIEDGVILLYHWSKNLQPPKDCYLALVAWTVTTPTHYVDGSKISSVDHVRLNSKWPEIINRINEELRREQKRLGIPPHFLGANEIQEERWIEKREVGLHAHYVLMNAYDSKAGSYLITTSKTDGIIKRAFSNFLGKEVNTSSSGKIEYVNTVAALGSYLTKIQRMGSYFSKGSQALEEVRKELPCMLSGMGWAIADAVTRKMVRASVEKHEIEGSIPEFREIVEDINREEEGRTGRVLFSDPWQYVKEDMPYVCSMGFKVREIKNTGYAINQLLSRLLDFKDTG